MIHRVPAIVLGEEEEKIQMRAERGRNLHTEGDKARRISPGGLELSSTGKTLVSCLLLQVGWL